MSTSLYTIFSWFETGDFPSQAQFQASWSSFWHKDEPIPISQITGLSQMIEQMVSSQILENHINDSNAHAGYLAKLDASNLTNTHVNSWKDKLGVGEIPPNVALVDMGEDRSVFNKDQIASICMLLENFVNSEGKILSTMLEALGMTELVPVNEFTLEDFLANHSVYSFQINDIIAIPSSDPTQGYRLYFYTGGDKTSVDSYLATGLTNVSIAMVQGLQTALDGKMNKPTASGNYYAKYLAGLVSWETINPASNYLIFWNGNDFVASGMYNSAAKYGIGTTTPSEMLHLYNGRLRTKAIVFDDNTETLPNQITLYNSRFYGADSAGTRRMLMYRDFDDYKALWTGLTDIQKNEIKTLANGGWTTATMSVFLINPVVVNNANNNKYVTLVGANLNLNPASFSIKIVDISGNFVADIPNSQVQVNNTTGQNLTFYYNFSAIPVGTYKLKLWNGAADYITPVTFRVADSLDNIDLSGVTWTALHYGGHTNENVISNNLLFATDATLKDSGGNGVPFPSQQLIVTSGLSSQICTMLDNFVIEIGLFFNNDPGLFDSYGGICTDQVNSLANTLLNGGRTTRIKFKTLSNQEIPGSSYSNAQRIIFQKNENILTTVLYTNSGSISTVQNVNIDNSPVKLKCLRTNWDLSPGSSSYDAAFLNLQIITAYKF